MVRIRDRRIARNSIFAQRTIVIPVRVTAAGTSDVLQASFVPGVSFEIADIQHYFKTATAPTAAAAVAAGGNTGNGTFSATPTVGANVEVGTYTFTCITKQTNAGVFRVTTPSGVVLANATVAVAYTGAHLHTFTIQDGATDFEVGDKFTVAVTGRALYNVKIGTTAAMLPNVIPPREAVRASPRLAAVALRRGTPASVINIHATTAAVAATGTSAAVAGNTGNGTITATPSTGAGCKGGVYRVTCIVAATDAGDFLVTDPDGLVVGVATVGSAFTKHLTFTITDGATDFAIGDQFTITVAAGAMDGVVEVSLVSPDAR